MIQRYNELRTRHDRKGRQMAIKKETKKKWEKRTRGHEIKQKAIKNDKEPRDVIDQEF
jgi:hypothetical protein